MEGFPKYLISIVAASLICSILLGIVANKGSRKGVIRLLCGIFLSLTIIRPLLTVRLDDLSLYARSITVDAQDAISYGETLSSAQRTEYIKQGVETYILDKAAFLEITLDVSVDLDADSGIPEGVTLSGTVAPLAKARLSEYIELELGIDKEDQHWIG